MVTSLSIFYFKLWITITTISPVQDLQYQNHRKWPSDHPHNYTTWPRKPCTRINRPAWPWRALHHHHSSIPPVCKQPVNGNCLTSLPKRSDEKILEQDFSDYLKNSLQVPNTFSQKVTKVSEASLSEHKTRTPLSAVFPDIRHPIFWGRIPSISLQSQPTVPL